MKHANIGLFIHRALIASAAVVCSIAFLVLAPGNAQAGGGEGCLTGAWCAPNAHCNLNAVTKNCCCDYGATCPDDPNCEEV
jgi:hypothetical protein